MRVLNPELKEDFEGSREKKMFSAKTEEILKEKLSQGVERFPDIIQCPNASCRALLTVKMQEDSASVFCSICGWSRLVKKNEVD